MTTWTFPMLSGFYRKTSKTTNAANVICVVLRIHNHELKTLFN